MKCEAKPLTHSHCRRRYNTINLMVMTLCRCGLPCGSELSTVFTSPVVRLLRHDINQIITEICCDSIALILHNPNMESLLHILH